jgi:hypothetical protein
LVVIYPFFTIVWEDIDYQSPEANEKEYEEEHHNEVLL